MPRKTLSDRTLKSLKPAAAGKRYELMDAVVPGMGIRVTDRGRKTFVLIARFPNSTINARTGFRDPSRRALGEYGELTLEQARAKARGWLNLIERGIDPAEEVERQRRAEDLKRANSFAAVARDFIAEKLPDERKGKEVARDIANTFLPAWGGRPVTEITDLDVLAVVKAKKATAPAQARNLLVTAKRLFSWAVDARVYGLRASPADSLKPAKIIGDRKVVDRVLSDAELFALWRAAKRMRYPYGAVYQLLVLTALRLNEAADASWSEFDLHGGLWVVPKERMKGKNTKARAHAVPLTAEIRAVLSPLPRFNRGKYLFSTNYGQTPSWMSDKVKKELDARMLRTLRALARRDGKDDPSDVELEPWVNHDIRRTVRSRLSRLKVTEEAREAVLAHVRPGIKGTYDHHDYLDEKREALEAWAARLREIVNPPPANVISLAKARR